MERARERRVRVGSSSSRPMESRREWHRFFTPCAAARAAVAAVAAVVAVAAAVVAVVASPAGQLCNGRLGDRSLHSLARLKNLTRLNVSQNMSLTPAGLQHLGSLTRLRSLNLSLCNVTPESLEHLTSAYPMRSCVLASANPQPGGCAAGDTRKPYKPPPFPPPPNPASLPPCLPVSLVVYLNLNRVQSAMTQ